MSNPKDKLENQNNGNNSSNTSAATAAAAAIEPKTQTFGVVLEINVATLDEETRHALMQVYDLPEVFTRAEYLKQLGSLTRSFAKDVLASLNAIEVRDYDYISLVDKYPASRKDRMVIETSQDHWDVIEKAARATADQAGVQEGRKITKALDKALKYRN